MSISNNGAESITKILDSELKVKLMAAFILYIEEHISESIEEAFGRNPMYTYKRERRDALLELLNFSKEDKAQLYDLIGGYL